MNAHMWLTLSIKLYYISVPTSKLQMLCMSAWLRPRFCRRLALSKRPSHVRTMLGNSSDSSCRGPAGADTGRQIRYDQRSMEGTAKQTKAASFGRFSTLALPALPGPQRTKARVKLSILARSL